MHDPKDPTPAADEISDEELDGVSGGMNTVTGPAAPKITKGGSTGSTVSGSGEGSGSVTEGTTKPGTTPGQINFPNGPKPQ